MAAPSWSGRDSGHLESQGQAQGSVAQTEALTAHRLKPGLWDIE
jgi:hypothetical protein